MARQLASLQLAHVLCSRGIDGPRLSLLLGHMRTGWPRCWASVVHKAAVRSSWTGFIVDVTPIEPEGYADSVSSLLGLGVTTGTAGRCGREVKCVCELSAAKASSGVLTLNSLPSPVSATVFLSTIDARPLWQECEGN
jgi:hypothetical protein